MPKAKQKCTPPSWARKSETSATPRLTKRFTATSLSFQGLRTNKHFTLKTRTLKPEDLKALSTNSFGGFVAVEPFEYAPDGMGAAVWAIGYLRGLIETG